MFDEVWWFNIFSSRNMIEIQSIFNQYSQEILNMILFTWWIRLCNSCCLCHRRDLKMNNLHGKKSKINHINMSMLKVCVANPPEALTSAGCAPAFPPGCDCDPLADPADSTCSADQECVQCKCLPLGCDCDPSAPDPNSFCPSGDVCKVIISPTLT